MSGEKKIRTALVSVFTKDNLEPIIARLHALGVEFISTGGTAEYIRGLGIPVKTVESLTGFPSILGGRVKTLHPNVFGGILGRPSLPADQAELDQFGIAPIDLLVVDLYPFAETLAHTSIEEDIIEKIDIGGVSLIRAGAKNYSDVLVISSRDHYPSLLKLLDQKAGTTSIEDRKSFATQAFLTTSNYDSLIHDHFAGISETPLRYGENPHQKGSFRGKTRELFHQLHGREISYNNLLDIDAALHLIHDFQETTVAILKHNNPCGLASDPLLLNAWQKALAGDPVSAFGGVIVSNRPIDDATASEMDKLFFEILLAPGFSPASLEILGKKKNRILLQTLEFTPSPTLKRFSLNGWLIQDRDQVIESPADLKSVTTTQPSNQEIADLLFANKIVKHSKSNAIVLAQGGQLLASGAGETSRIDALKHAIEKASHFGFDLTGAVMASDAFFPFADCVELAHQAGIGSVIQPGGSMRDQESIDFCNAHGMSMVFTGYRHFKH